MSEHHQCPNCKFMYREGENFRCAVDAYTDIAVNICHPELANSCEYFAPLRPKEICKKEGSLLTNALILCIWLAFIGYVVANVFGCSFIGCLLASLAALGVVFVAFVLGAICFMHTVETCAIQQLDDGKDDVIMALKLGPFVYKRTLPVVEERKDTNQ